MVKRVEIIGILYWGQRPMTSSEIAKKISVDPKMVIRVSSKLAKMRGVGCVKIVEKRLNHIYVYDLSPGTREWYRRKIASEV